MKKILFTCIIALLTACSAPQKYNIESVASKKGTEVFQPNWENIANSYRFPEWFSDAKFGIFIHWGVYSVPAYTNEWYPRNMYIKDSREYKHHIEKWGNHEQFGYKDFIPMFTAEKFNAEEWISLFKEAGAKYVVPVAEHHDGFSMYDSELNKWNAVNMGPKKDIIGLLKKAAESQDMIFGLSTHKAENAWFFNGGMDFPSDVQDSTIALYGKRYKNEAYTEAFVKEWLMHTYELIDKYQPQLIWFDWTVNNPIIMPYFNKFMAHYYNNALDWGKGVVVNTKQGYPTHIQVWDVERGKSGNMMQFPWQTDTSIGKKSWSYIDGEENKTPQQIVHDLIDIVSKNGNLLLNIGPKPDGSITDEQKSVLLSIGKWLKINGEGIYETRCWKKYGEGKAQSIKGSFTDNEATQYSVQDIRFTSKGNDIYAIVLNWGEKTVIKSLNKTIIGDAQITNINLLGTDEKINWASTEEGLIITFPSTPPCEYAYTFKISFDKEIGKGLESEAINEVMKHGG